MEFDRRRAVKEQLLQVAITAAMDMWSACRALAETGPLTAAPVAKGDAPVPLAWEPDAIALELALLQGDEAKARHELTNFSEHFRGEPLLYTALSDGGDPRLVLRTRMAQGTLRRLASALPRLGLLRESFQLLKMARALEQAHPPGKGGVTEFNELFRGAYQACVEAALESMAPAAAFPQAERVEILEALTRPFLQMWIEHSQTLRLSALETCAGDDEFGKLADFVRKYGGELFHAKFLTLANIRSVLHRGVDNYLDYLRDDPQSPDTLQLVEDLGSKLRRPEVVGWISCVLQAIVENYEEYKDYNTTTPQSDYGENLHQLLDYLRLKAAYDRQAWRLKPLLLANEVLARRGQTALALAWQTAFAGITEEWRRSVHGTARAPGTKARHAFTHGERSPGRTLHAPARRRSVRRFVGPAMEAAKPEGSSRRSRTWSRPSSRWRAAPLGSASTCRIG